MPVASQPLAGPDALAVSDNFDGPRLKPAWEWNYQPPNQTFSSPVPNSVSGGSNAFGTITSQANGSRKVQFAPRFDF